MTDARSYRALERVLDLGAAGVALVALSPLLAALAVLVAARMGQPVLFRQVRPGHRSPVRPDEVPDDADARTSTAGRRRRAAADAFGPWLRRTSLDELPELVNVLKGEMSLVGPRPLLMEYLSLYSPDQARRHEVPPGITGWAQVNGRNALDWTEKLGLDVWYVDTARSRSI